MAIQHFLMELITQHPVGHPLLARELLVCGSRDAVDQALFRMVRQGVLVRVSRGVYARPARHPVFGEIPITVGDIVRAYSESLGCKVQVAGDAAINMLGLSTQVPVGVHFYTDGGTRHIKRGKQTIFFQHVNAKVMVCAGTEGAAVLSAMYSLGKARVNEEFVQALSNALTLPMKSSLAPALPKMIGWMRKILTPLVTHQQGG